MMLLAFAAGGGVLLAIYFAVRRTTKAWVRRNLPPSQVAQDPWVKLLLAFMMLGIAGMLLFRGRPIFALAVLLLAWPFYLVVLEATTLLGTLGWVVYRRIKRRVLARRSRE